MVRCWGCAARAWSAHLLRFALAPLHVRGHRAPCIHREAHCRLRADPSAGAVGERVRVAAECRP
eukprot:14256232-Alexandrium_andersonii.AAC.1